MARPDFASVDDYIAAQPALARATLERVRKTIRKALPGASEGISYQIPVYKKDGAMVLYFAGFKGHYSIYPATARLIAALGDDAAGILHNRATLRFSYADAVPTRLVTRIVKLRAEEAAELQEAKAAKKAGAKKATSSSKKATSKKGPRAKAPAKKSPSKAPARKASSPKKARTTQPAPRRAASARSARARKSP